MKIGLIPVNIGVSTAAEVVGLARLAEDSGFESVWTFEHVVVPLEYESKYPYDASGKMGATPETPLFDPLIALTAAAAGTKTIRLGTGVNILPQSNPLFLAKQAASLDALCFGGVLAWGRFARRAGAEPPASGLSRNGPVSVGLRDDLDWLLDPLDADLALTGAAADVYEYLRDHGASFTPDIVSGARRLPSEVNEGLWVLAAAGAVTADGFGALRGLISGVAKRTPRRSHFARRSQLGAASRMGSRWSLLAHPVAQDAPDVHDRSRDSGTVEARAAQLLRRYGIVTRELVAREPLAPPWGVLARAYRRAEARGEVRGGRFVAGLVGEQFALQEAVDAVRAVHRREPSGEVVRVSACDPLNLVGILTPGARSPAVLGNEVFYRDGVPIPGEALQPAAVPA